MFLYAIFLCVWCKNHNHHQINSLYKRVFVVYFYFVEKMGNFRYDPRM